MIEETQNEPSIPNSLLTKLYDQTGTRNCSHKGFLMFYINEDGDPSCIGKFENAATQLSIQGSLEKFIDKNIESE